MAASGRLNHFGKTMKYALRYYISFRDMMRSLSLVEALIIIAIIGILTAIAYPQFAQYKARGLCVKAGNDKVFCQSRENFMRYYK